MADNKKQEAENNDKAKALQIALAQIEKQFGKGAIMRMDDKQVENDIQTVVDDFKEKMRPNFQLKN